jgi:hypothetical protein
MAVMFLSMVSLGVVMTALGRSAEVMEVTLDRSRARSDLLSLMNASLRWLGHEVGEGRRPRAPEGGSLTDFDALRVFSSGDVNLGFVAVYDLEYDPRTLEAVAGEALSFLPLCPLGYMIRATVERQGWAPFTIEAVFRLQPVLTPTDETEYVLERKPLLWRELRR